MNGSLHKGLYLPTICLLVAGLMIAACQSPKASEKTCKDDTPIVDSNVLHFIPTMQHPIPSDRNAVYAASLPLAWRVLRQELKATTPIQTDATSLSLLDNMSTQVDALNNTDYQRKVTRFGDGIRVETRQKVDLTFEPAFDDLPGQLRFDSIPVSAFGSRGEQNAAHPHQVDILIYRNDNHFAVRLNPLEHDHEILLFKAECPFEDFAQMYQVLQKEHQQGERERMHPAQLWRYQLTDEDELVIPKITFDKQYSYPEYAGKTFALQQKKYTLQEVSQNIAFAINEYGVSMETGATVIVNMGAIPSDDRPTPKMLLFDKPFYVIMKKSDRISPYLVLYVSNSLLLEKKGEKR